MTTSAELVRLAQVAIAALVALLMLRAALHKIGDLTSFEGVLADYGLAPEWALPSLRVLLPIIELAVAAALAYPGLAPWGAGAGSGVLLVYAAAMAGAQLRGRTQIDCGCGGPPLPLSWWLVARNVALAALLAPLALQSPAWPMLSVAATTWALALIALAVWAGVEQLAANLHRMDADRGLASAAMFGRDA